MTAALAAHATAVVSLPVGPPSWPGGAPTILPTVPLDRRDRPLIGRGDALEAIREVSQQGPGPNVVVITGEAGIGKSRLLDQLIGDYGRQGWHVLCGGCVELSGDPIPYAPIAEALRRLRRETDDPAVHAAVDTMLGAGGGAAPRDQAELFERMIEIVDRMSAQTPLLLALEDLHWADQGTLDLISFLMRNLDGEQLFVLTYRSEEWQLAPGLRRLIETLARSRRVSRVELARLTRDEIAELAHSVTDTTPTEDELDELHARSQGNPFIAEELLVSDDGLTVPSSLQEILLARASRIDPDAEHLVRVMALLGRPVAHDLLTDASQLDPTRFAHAVGQAVGSGLLIADPARAEYAFRHVLTEQAVRERILPAERRRLHAAIAAALAVDPSVTQSASRAAEWAAHVVATGDRAAALTATLRAARMAALVYAYATAWRQFTRVVELLDHVDVAAVTGDAEHTVLAEAAEAARWGGDLGAAVRLAARAVDACPDPARRAALTERTGRYLVEEGRLDDAEDHFTRARAMADGLGELALDARIAASQARLLMQTGRDQQAIPAARAAIELATAADVPLEAGRAHTALGMSLVLLGSVDEGVSNLRLGRDLVHAHGDLDDRRRADSNLSYALLIAGSTGEACDVSVSGLQTMRRYGLAAAGGGALTSNTIVLLRMSGRWDEAEELSDEAEAQGLAEGLALRIALSRTELEIARGEVDRARSRLDRAWDLAGAQPSADVLADLYLAEANIALGRQDTVAAVTAVDRAAERLDDGTPRLSARTCVVGLRIEGELANARPRSRDAGRGTERADRFHARLQAASELTPSPELRAYELTGGGEYARAVRRSDPDVWHEAGAQWDALERPRGVAYCLLRQAEAELGLRRSGAARTSLRRAHALALELGAQPIVAEARALAALGRVPLDEAEDSGGVVVTGPGDAALRLTARELQVLTELAAGLSNREIADKLYLSHRTVGVHVSNLLAKLGARSRTEAAAAAAQLHLLDNGRNT